MRKLEFIDKEITDGFSSLRTTLFIDGQETSFGWYNDPMSCVLLEYVGIAEIIRQIQHEMQATAWYTKVQALTDDETDALIQSASQKMVNSQLGYNICSLKTFAS